MPARVFHIIHDSRFLSMTCPEHDVKRLGRTSPLGWEFVALALDARVHPIEVRCVMRAHRSGYVTRLIAEVTTHRTHLD